MNKIYKNIKNKIMIYIIEHMNLIIKIDNYIENMITRINKNKEYNKIYEELDYKNNEYNLNCRQ